MKKYLCVLCVFVTSILLLNSCGDSDKEDNSSTISGFVTDLTNANAPIAGATVTLSSKGISQTTGSDGRYQFSDVDPGSYTIQVIANNYQSTTKQVTVGVNQNVSCDFQLSKGETSIEISPQTLTFGKGVEQLAFTITNNSTRSLTYSISNTPDYIEVTPTSGTVVSRGRQAVSVHVLNRSSITTNRTGQLTVNVGNDSYIVSVAVTNSTITDPDSGEDNPNGGGNNGEIVVPNGLFAYFTFENTTKDVTEQELNGVGIGTSFVDSYNATQALKIPAQSSAMLSIPNSLIDQQRMSVSFWVKDIYDGHIFHAVRNYDNKPAFLLAMENGKLKFVVTRYDIGHQWANRPSFIHGSLSGWHMITLVSDFNQTTYSKITTRLYLDGILTDTVTEDDNPFSEKETGADKNYDACIKFILGGELNESYVPTLAATKLVVDNIRFYRSRMLTTEEVKAIYDAEKK